MQKMKKIAFIRERNYRTWSEKKSQHTWHH